MSKHRCQAEILRPGQKFWGSPSERPCVDPIPPELLDMHPDVLTDWDNCEHCGTPTCGRVANFKIEGTDGEETIWLCADHFDEFMAAEPKFPVWHECRERGLA
jgi:hypothetical protein